MAAGFAGICIMLLIMSLGLREELRLVLKQCDRLEKKIRELKALIDTEDK